MRMWKEFKDLTWHVAKADSKAKVEQNIEPNESANAKPVPIILRMLAVGIKDTNTDALGATWRRRLQTFHVAKIRTSHVR